MKKWPIDKDMVASGAKVARKLLAGREMTLDGFFEAMVPCNPGETQAIIDELNLRIFRVGRTKHVSLPDTMSITTVFFGDREGWRIGIGTMLFSDRIEIGLYWKKKDRPTHTFILSREEWEQLIEELER